MIIKKGYFSSLVLSLVMTQMFACAHDGAPKKLKKSSDTEVLTTQESPAPATQTDSVSDQKQPVTEPARGTPDAVAIYSRLVSEDGALISEDSQSADELIEEGQPGTIAEAVVAIVSLYESIPELGKKAPGFGESDLYPGRQSPPQQQTEARPPSIESIARKRQLDLVKALAANPFLQSHRVQSLALRAVEPASVTETFRGAVLANLKSHYEAWSELRNKISMRENGTPESTEQPVIPADTAPIQPALKFGSSDIGQDDVILQEAQSLADKGQYKQSVARLSQLGEDSALYATAQEKIRDASNKAVQDLRRLAAKAFQNALPITDPKVKAGYLKEARAHLETALSTYPQADQLATVRENLAVINRDLARLPEVK